MRDDFTEKTKTTLAQRVGYRCSNPGCRAPTSGPHVDVNKSTIVGEAAHITGAAPGGYRYDPTLSHSQRRHINNGIWLCCTCARLIDRDEQKYPPELLREWKSLAEASAYRSIKGLPLITVDADERTSIGTITQPKDGILSVPWGEAETLRVRALSLLTLKDVEQARLLIHKAQELEPGNHSLSFSTAIVDYYSALSPVAIPPHLLPWPQPVDPVLVRRDDNSIQHLRNAEALFRRLASMPRQSRLDRQRLTAWQLACLANDASRQEDALALCRSLLQNDPTDYHIIPWIVDRGYDLDLEPSERSLATLIRDGSATIQHILALVTCYIEAQKPSMALELLESSLDKFRHAQADDLWVLWHVQLLVLNGDFEAASKAIGETPEEAEWNPLHAIVLHGRALENNDWQSFVDLFDSGFQRTKDYNLLLQLCMLKAQQGDWGFIASHAEELVEAIGTAEALHLATIGVFNNKQPELCLHLIRRYRHFYSQGRLPDDLTRIQVWCNEELGNLPAALDEAERLAQHRPTIEHLGNLARLYTNVGNWAGLVNVARKLNGLPDVPQELSLQLAGLIQSENRSLAISLWRNALSTDLNDVLVPMAWFLGQQLGIDHIELQPLSARLPQLAQQKNFGIWMVSIDELRSIIRSQYERAIHTSEQYQQGTVPIHLVVEELNHNLAWFYHTLLLENASITTMAERRPLLARHGSRRLAGNPFDLVSEFRLNTDITAILLANHLGILETVCKEFTPLRISRNLVPALQKMRADCLPLQASRLALLNQIVDLVEKGQIHSLDTARSATCDNDDFAKHMGKSWSCLYEQARAGGCLVDFLPLKTLERNDPPLPLIEETKQYLVNCRAVVEALWRGGPVSKRSYEKALDDMGKEGIAPTSEVIPAKGSTLYLCGGTLDVLADADVLSIVCENFHVMTDDQNLNRIRKEIDGQESKAELMEWLGSLIDHISNGLQAGSYEVIPQTNHVELPPDVADQFDPESQCLLSILGMTTEPNDLFWADDRFINRHAFGNGSLILGVNEILKELLTRRALTPAEYYAKLAKLRAEHVMFIPLEKDEVFYHLSNASVQDEVLRETEELVILRRYVAACLLQGASLQKPSPSASGAQAMGEVAFILNLESVACETLAAVWGQGELDERSQIAQSEWLLENLHTSLLGISLTTAFPTWDASDRHLAGLSATRFIAVSLSFEYQVNGDKKSPRRQYLEWVNNRILNNLIIEDPPIALTITDLVKATLRNCVSVVRSETETVVYRLVCREIYEGLPEAIQTELSADTDFMQAIGLETRLAIWVGNAFFAPEEFWQAAASALNGNETEITSLEQNLKFVFGPTMDDRDVPAVNVHDPRIEKDVRITGDEFALLAESITEREAALRRHREWFACEDETFDRAVAEIATCEEPYQRIEMAESWKQQSPIVFYRTLYTDLGQRQRTRIDYLLPPNADRLLQYFRLKPDAKAGHDFHDALSAAVETVIRENGILAAIDRFSGLPVPIPAFLEAARELSASDRRPLIQKLLRIPGTPISKLHFIRLLVSWADEDPAFKRLAQRVVKSLFGEQATKEYKAFKAILDWSVYEFDQWKETRSWSTVIKLCMVWSHAQRIFTIFTAAGAPLEWIKNTFSQLNIRISATFFERVPEFWYDVAHPRQLNGLRYLISGLAYALGDEASDFISEQVIENLTRESTILVDNYMWPHPTLLRGLTQTHNALESFLGGNLSKDLLRLNQHELAEATTEEALHSLVESAICSLMETPADFSAWLLLHGVLGDRPPP